MYVDKGKKKKFSLHLFVFKCLNPICICYLFEFKYFNYVYKKKKKNTKLLLPKKKKILHLSHTKGKKKKKHDSHHPFVFKCLIPIYICYLFEFKYFNYVYQKKKKQNYFLKKPHYLT